jgi:hypothetical protein
VKEEAVEESYQKKMTFPSLVVRKWRLEEGKKIFHPFQMRGKGNGGITIHYPPTPKEKEVANNRQHVLHLLWHVLPKV